MMWLILCAAFVLVVGTGADNALQVETTSGTVQGTVVHLSSDRKAESFLGVSYAKAPVGDLRFAPPEPFHQDEVIQATAFGHSCPQLTTGFDDDIPFIRGPEGETEDCLNLNVWTPHPRPDHAPVLVFIHGGVALSTGSAAEPHYQGDILANLENIVVVSINYRLAELGFLYLGTPDAPGNVGIMDQTLALKWVKDNIAHFGGDPEKVTLFGESAGALSVGFHMLIPSGKDLFQRAILLDGAPTSRLVALTKDHALRITHNVSEAAGCNDSDNDPIIILKCLREKSLSELISATIKGAIMKQEFFFPVIDGEYLPDDPNVLLKSGKSNNEIEVLVGTSFHRGFTANRYIIHQKPTEDHVITNEDLRTLISRLFRHDSEFLKKVIQFHYTDWKHPDCPKATRHEAIDLTSDVYFICPANRFAAELSVSGHDVYRFHFASHKNSSQYPAWVGFLDDEQFDLIFGHATQSKGYTEAEEALSHTLMDYIVQFMKTGNPNEEGHSCWPRYNLRDKSYLRIEPGNKLGGSIQQHLNTQECSFWKKGYKIAKQASELLESKHCH